MLVYDLTDRQSFEDLAFFHRRFISLTRAWRDPDAPPLPIVVVANKCDLPRSQWVVTRQEAKQWCALHASSISTKAGAGWVRSGSGAGTALLRQFGLESPAVSSSSRSEGGDRSRGRSRSSRRRGGDGKQRRRRKKGERSSSSSSSSDASSASSSSSSAFRASPGAKRRSLKVAEHELVSTATSAASSTVDVNVPVAEEDELPSALPGASPPNELAKQLSLVPESAAEEQEAGEPGSSAETVFSQRPENAETAAHGTAAAAAMGVDADADDDADAGGIDVEVAEPDCACNDDEGPAGAGEKKRAVVVDAAPVTDAAPESRVGSLASAALPTPPLLVRGGTAGSIVRVPISPSAGPLALLSTTTTPGSDAPEVQDGGARGALSASEEGSRLERTTTTTATRRRSSEERQSEGRRRGSSSGVSRRRATSSTGDSVVAHFQVSARTGQNVYDVFEAIATLGLEATMTSALAKGDDPWALPSGHR